MPDYRKARVTIEGREEDWAECDCCKKNVVQILARREVFARVFVERRGFANGRETVEGICQDEGFLYHEVDEGLCYACYLARYGSDELGRLSFGGWVDRPVEGARPEGPPGKIKQWEDKQKEDAEALVRRELGWVLQDVDMFEDGSA